MTNLRLLRGRVPRAVATTMAIGIAALGASTARGTLSGTGQLKIATSKVIFTIKDIVRFAQHHPKFKTIAVLVVVANEIRGLVMVVAYLNIFGLALPT